MPKAGKHSILQILSVIFLFIVLSAGILTLWLSNHYKTIINERLPEIVTKGSDSIYHISFSDISINVVTHHISLTNVKLWPDLQRAKELLQARRKIPPTLSTVFLPRLDAYGVNWGDLAGKRSLDCRNVVVSNLRWLLSCTPVPGDSLFTTGESKHPFIDRIHAAHVEFIDPDITYHYRGQTDTFFCFLLGGTASLNDWAYNYDEDKDTSVFLYAKNGKVRLDSFVFLKESGRYAIEKPLLDFETTPGSVTIRNVAVTRMADRDPTTGNEKEIYKLSFPSTELKGFNWNRLIMHNTLAANTVNALSPQIHIHYIRQYETKTSRKGDYPNQLLLKAGLETNLETINIKNGLFRYTEVTKNKEEAVIEFTDINGRMSHVTNIDSAIAQYKNCTVNLHGKYMGKSPVSANFKLGLTDNTGKFKVNGYLENLDGKEVSQQAAVFTLVKVTSFHLNHMDIHIEGDETYAKGNFTVLYNDLKISLAKFDTKLREKKKGTLSFLGSALLLYPGNPMPNKDIRRVTTSFARDTTKGFIYLIWENMYRAAKKTAVRDQSIVTFTDGPETTKGEAPKKGFLKRLFGKKD